MCEATRIDVKYTWIERHRRQWPVTLQCEVLGVSASGYFERQVRLQAGTTRGTGTTQQVGRGRLRVSDEALLAHIKAAHAASKGEYGWRIRLAAHLEGTAGAGCAGRQRAHLDYGRAAGNFRETLNKS